jgi:ATP phosphoribosyltransferase
MATDSTQQTEEPRTRSTSFTRPVASGMDLTDRFLFAVPKKGRLYESTLKLLDGIDLEFNRKHRLDIALCKNLPVAIVFLPASDIARFVGEGNVDLGITGLDVVKESGMTDKVEIIERLGFGKCKLQVQVPEASGLNAPEDLLGKRIVTSFERVASEYFEELKQKTNCKTPAHVTYISGSVEAACSLGLADGIVDLVESGETMRAAKLKPIATILETETVLLSNNRSKSPELVKLIAERIRGVLTASRHLLVKFNIQKDNLKTATKITPGNRAPTVSPLEDDKWVAVEAMIKKQDQGTILDQLSACGARDILVIDIHNCRV